LVAGLGLDDLGADDKLFLDDEDACVVLMEVGMVCA
jgi:hypothetical protein